MPSHFSSIGFPIGGREDFEKLALQVVNEGQSVQSPRGSYFYLRAERAELWASLTPDRELIGVAPHFAGSAVMRVGLTSRLESPDMEGLEGSFYGWADPAGGDYENTGAYPFVFEAIAFATQAQLQLPALVEVQLTAFAHELTAYSSEAAFDEAQGQNEAKFAPQSFFPTSLFQSQSEGEIPEAYAMFYGHVRETARLVNSFTQQPYHWAKVETLGGEIDVVADPQVLQGDLAVGGVVSVYGWLSGRIVRKVQLN
ncbi:MAG TPA: hypothetical protein VFS50_14075 [Meiothermus sp.]|jgi:hypothetical protein|nr:hypothetical protein [Meiothermus sp.]